MANKNADDNKHTGSDTDTNSYGNVDKITYKHTYACGHTDADTTNCDADARTNISKRSARANVRRIGSKSIIFVDRDSVYATY